MLLPCGYDTDCGTKYCSKCSCWHHVSEGRRFLIFFPKHGNYYIGSSDIAQYCANADELAEFEAVQPGQTKTFWMRAVQGPSWEVIITRLPNNHPMPPRKRGLFARLFGLAA